MVGSRPPAADGNSTGPPDRPLNAADVFVFAPIGLAIRASQLLPAAIQSSKAEYEKRAATAQLLGRFIVAQQRRKRHLAAVSAATSRPPSKTVEMPREKPVGQGEFAPTPRRDASASSEARAAGGASDVAAHTPLDLPIDGYDTLPARSLLALFDGLTAEQIEVVRQHELANRRRETVLNRLAHLQQASVLGEDG